MPRMICVEFQQEDSVPRHSPAAVGYYCRDALPESQEQLMSLTDGEWAGMRATRQTLRQNLHRGEESGRETF